MLATSIHATAAFRLQLEAQSKLEFCRVQSWRQLRRRPQQVLAPPLQSAARVSLAIAGGVGYSSGHLDANLEGDPAVADLRPGREFYTIHTCRNAVEINFHWRTRDDGVCYCVFPSSKGEASCPLTACPAPFDRVRVKGCLSQKHD